MGGSCALLLTCKEVDLQSCLEGRQGLVIFKGGGQGVPRLCGSAGERGLSYICFVHGWHQVVVCASPGVVPVGVTNSIEVI